MLPSIPRNSYPNRPHGYADFFSAHRSDRKIRRAGHVPVWTTFYDAAGPPRMACVLIIRILPTLEVVLLGAFRKEPVSIKRAIKERLRKSHWPERNWWVSHVTYVAKPPKRQSEILNAGRFCNGLVRLGPNRMRLLAHVSVPRLRVVVEPREREDASVADVGVFVDESKSARSGIQRFLLGLASLERWERPLVHRALGHLLGISYGLAMERGISQLGTAIDVAIRQECAHLRSYLNSPCEEFKPIRWLRDSDPPESGLVGDIMLGFSRLPMGGGPDLELSLRPHIPPELRDVVQPTLLVEPSQNMAILFDPHPRTKEVQFRWVINPLSQYRRVHDHGNQSA